MKSIIKNLSKKMRDLEFNSLAKFNYNNFTKPLHQARLLRQTDIHSYDIITQPDTSRLWRKLRSLIIATVSLVSIRRIEILASDTEGILFPDPLIC